MVHGNFRCVLNIHHLELFYYVARYEGIMEAVRNMPYGIQQPAVSGQILQLESDLGVKLFNRRPFELTAAGRELFDFIRPFFDRVENLGEKIRGGVAQSLRMAAPEMVLRDHLPEILGQVRRKFPHLRLTLRGAHQPQVESWLERQEIDFAVTVLEGKPRAGLNSQPLLELPVVFLLHHDHPARTAADVFESLVSGDDAFPLITLPPNELLPRLFRELLAKRGLEWPTSIEVNALELIGVYVAGGFGVGLSVSVPQETLHPQIGCVPIPELGSITIGALWRGDLPLVTQELLKALQARASGLKKAKDRR